ncbi:MAG TPA: NAD(P)-dependent oxidoreductase [Steroidobacteraceae bacterium]|nr:NAD(P)-dependent oxidoreductase [Steroidobacteraceae bacterium]
MDRTGKVILTGGAGLVGQNLILLLTQKGYRRIVSIDKNTVNNAIIRELHPEVTVIDADLAEPGSWEREFQDAAALVLLQAQISGLTYSQFAHNTLGSTERVLAAARLYDIPYLVHVSSSVINSRADDHYSRSKRAQEEMVRRTGLKTVILRPTLMFGWFDRKHLGWLARFMTRAPVFPIPGSGRYVRQALFELDFCAIIAACLERELTGEYNISGLERIHYIDLIQMIKDVTGARTPIVRIPYRLFWLLIGAYALIDRHPPFTTQQLEALVIPEEFEMIDWPRIFGVATTPLREALLRTFREKPYCDIVLTP